MKVLVFSHNCFSNTSNNGKTLLNIFSAFSKEELCQLYISDKEKPDFSLCNSYFQISDMEILRFFFNPFQYPGKVIEDKEANVYVEDSTKKTYSGKINGVRTIIRNFLWNHSNWFSPRLKKWIEKENPNCIFFVGGNYTFSHKMAVKISKKYVVPLVTYFTDDYILYPKYKNIIQRVYKFVLLQSFYETINNSALLFTIGESMSKEYGDFFNKKFYYIMNCVEFKPKEISLPNGKKRVISYFGGLHLKRAEAILKFAKYIDNLNEGKYDITINVYTFSVISENLCKEYEKQKIILRKPVKGSTYDAAIKASDCLLHIEADDNYIKMFTRLSVSTKIPEYLISSKLIIAFGPTDQAAIALILNNNLGVVIDSRTFSSNYNLLDCIEDRKLEESLIENSYNYAKEHFLKENVSKKFRYLLEQSI